MGAGSRACLPAVPAAIAVWLPLCRQLERQQSSASDSTVQLKHLQAELALREAEVVRLRAEAEALQRELHNAQVLRLGCRRRWLHPC